MFWVYSGRLVVLPCLEFYLRRLVGTCENFGRVLSFGKELLTVFQLLLGESCALGKKTEHQFFYAFIFFVTLELEY